MLETRIKIVFSFIFKIMIANFENNGFYIEKDLVKKNINGKYKFLIVTEDLARNNFKANYNIESNPDTRLLFNSGVVFHKPYFNLKLKSSEILLADILLKVNADLDSSIVELFIWVIKFLIINYEIYYNQIIVRSTGRQNASFIKH